MKTRGFLLGIVCGLLPFSMVCAQEKQDDNTLLWEITGNGAEQPSYLYGTMHVSNKMVYNFQDTFYVALKSVDVVALEINLDSFLVYMIKSGTFHLYREYFAGMRYNDDFYTAATELRNMDIELYREELATKDELLNDLMFRTGSDETEYEEQTYLDLFIFQAAKKLRKQVSNLEDFERSEKYSYLAMVPDKDAKDDYNYEDESRRRHLVEQLETAYRNADLDLIDSITRTKSYSKNYYHYFIVERNRMMANTIDSTMKSGRSIFAACGVAHLPGDSGVIQMLRSYGYTLRPVKTAVTNKSHKNRQQIEKMVCPPKMVPFTAVDSSFSVKAPGPMHPIPSYNEIERYLYPDMANGSFYQVSHIPVYGGIKHHGKDEYCAQLDSFLYEVTPGDIIQKEINKSNPEYYVYDVTSRVSLDNYLRFQIYVGDFDLYIFKLMGIKEYVTSKFAQEFFNSVKLGDHKKADYKQFDFPEAGFSVELPGKIYTENFITPDYTCSVSGNVDMLVQSEDPRTDRYYLVAEVSMFDFDYIEEDAFELDYLADKLVSEKPFNLVWKRNSGANEPLSKEFHYSDSAGYHLFLKTVINGPHYYMMMVHQPDSTYPERFFNSFQRKDYVYKMAFLPYTDPEQYFTVNTTPFREQINNCYSYKYERMLDQLDNEVDDDDLDQYYLRWQNRFSKFCSGISPECVSVGLTYESPYCSYDDLNAFWKKKKDILLRRGSMKLVSESYTASPDSIPSAFFILGDTASSRTVIIKMMLKGGALYTLKAVGQNGEFCGEWTRQFFETFKPTDTLIGDAPFGDKTSLFLSHLSGEDSVLRKKALALSWTLDPDSTLTTGMIQFIQSEKYNKLKAVRRCELIELLADSANNASLPLLEQLYRDAGDSAEIKFTVLRVLAAVKTEQSAKMLQSLILEDPPLSTGSYQTDYLFDEFDSTGMAKLLFPDLMNLTRYMEYRSPVYELLSAQLKEKMIKPDLYRSHISEVIADAGEHYKRMFADEADYGDDDYHYFSEYSESDDIDELRTYISLLLPYDSLAGVKKYIGKLSKSTVRKFQFALLIEQIAEKDLYQDSLVNYFCSADLWRNRFYKELVKTGDTGIFDTTYLTQIAFARSAAFKDQEPPDSIAFLERRQVSTKAGEGYVYFFKCKDNDDDNWRLRYSGIQPIDEGKVDPEPRHYSGKGSSFANAEEQEKLIKVAMDKIKTKGRKRVYRCDYCD